MAPLSNAFVRPDQADRMESFYPLCAKLCHNCFLVQIAQYETPDKIFTDYAYFSSYSESWLQHARAFAESITQRIGLGPASKVVEIASNDGYLLRHFRALGIPVLGIEPARNVALAAEAAGIPTRCEFFSTGSAERLLAEGVRADLLVGNNVLAHVPDLNDFVRGLKLLLGRGAMLTMEFPHLLQMMQQGEFDTIYHEHFSYFSLMTASAVFTRHGLTICDAEEIATHGGSLRVYARHSDEAPNVFLIKLS